MNNFTVIENMKGHADVKIIRQHSICVALSGWNGEEYTDCWECDELGYAIDDDAPRFSMIPVMRSVDDDWEIIDYKRMY